MAGALLLLEHQRKQCLAQTLRVLQGPVRTAWQGLLWQKRKDRSCDSGTVARDLPAGLMEGAPFQAPLVYCSSFLHEPPGVSAGTKSTVLGALKTAPLQVPATSGVPRTFDQSVANLAGEGTLGFPGLSLGSVIH